MTDYSVIVSPSKIKGAGLGLFATKAFKSGEVVCNYGGELILTDIAMSNDYHSDYLFKINNDWTIDGQDFTSSGFGRFINDPIFTNKANCAIRANYKLNKNKKRIYDLTASVVVLKDKTIKANAEILISYGNSYWVHEGKFGMLNNKQQLEVHANTTKQGKDWIEENYVL